MYIYMCYKETQHHTHRISRTNAHTCRLTHTLAHTRAPRCLVIGD